MKVRNTIPYYFNKKSTIMFAVKVIKLKKSSSENHILAEVNLSLLAEKGNNAVKS